ncbi:hypothetical protein EBB07_14625 [Paenibacillaceae bacterium]|nr:hypothetical protein EBB07_14625 [Paenibacillaceae bacterium]
MGILYNGVSMDKFMDTVAAKEIEFGGMAGTKVPNIGKLAFSTTFYNNAFTKKEYQNQLNTVMDEFNDMNWFMSKIHRANFHLYRINILLGQKP